MTINITSKIIGYEVVTGIEQAPAAPLIEHMHELVQRPESLEGSTYKIKTPLSEHALYVTINDILLNPGTEDEIRRPFEIFINSKNMDHFQWIVALTRILSAVFRKGGDCTFLAEELRSVFDPRGGYFKKGGRFVPSLVAELGDVLDIHLRKIGMLVADPPDPHRQGYIERVRAQMVVPTDTGGFPTDARLCNHCNTRAAVQLDGCLTCLNCGESKCE